MIRVKVEDGPRELRAAVLAMSKADRDIRRDVSSNLRSTMNPEWRSELAQHTSWTQDRILVAGARIVAGNPPALVTATSRRRYGSGGGLIPNEHWAGFEYGAADHKKHPYWRTNRKAGGRHLVERDVLAGHPARTRHGRVIGPAVRNILPRVAAFWTQSVVRAFLDAAEKGQ